jgi:hypothetical protein
MYVFVSYNHFDAEIANQISAVLAQLGIDYFLDVKDLQCGDHIESSVTRAIEEATHLIAIVSPGSAKSQWVPYEIGQARARAAVVIPYLTHRALDLPPYLTGIKYASSMEELGAHLAQMKAGGSGSTSRPTRDVLQATESRYRRWKELGYSGRGSALIPYDAFLAAEDHWGAFAGQDDLKRAYILRCAVQNGMGARWGKWLRSNAENRLIVEPLFMALQGDSGWKPMWRSAYILQATFGRQLEVAISRLAATSGRLALAQSVIEVMIGGPVNEYLSRVGSSGDRRDVDAKLVSGEIAVFKPDLDDYAARQTVASQWLASLETESK